MAQSDSEFIRKIKEMAARLGRGDGDRLQDERVIDELIVARSGQPGNWIDLLDGGQAPASDRFDAGWLGAGDDESANEDRAARPESGAADAPNRDTMPDAVDRPTRRKRGRVGD